ncbi:hypothetical protein RB1492 [Rhodopirellula baltica SH 1]|uniref:Uncharacterized protein n=1 Tax=Rhodopirellula baltica (strain DSM 10527 / NCIMB 13988 / SH1) TaxID=243090 RepID=Q7UX86_RHOBA|nr:hypothetical protein RB1492 [Rhodopirellula baltica SH 1]
MLGKDCRPIHGLSEHCREQCECDSETPMAECGRHQIHLWKRCGPGWRALRRGRKQQASGAVVVAR